jgi:hypothetical protein
MLVAARDDGGLWVVEVRDVVVEEGHTAFVQG